VSGDGPALEAGAATGNEYAIIRVEAAPKLEWPYYWHVFSELSTTRQFGMGVGPISVPAIREEAERDNLSPIETEALVEIIRRLDNHVVAKAAKDAERRSKRK
jgi:hypothetical protein